MQPFPQPRYPIPTDQIIIQSILTLASVHYQTVLYCVWITGVFLDSTTEFTVDARSITPSCAGKVRAIITNPSGNKYDTAVTPNGDGTYHVSYAPNEAGISIASLKNTGSSRP